MIDEKIIDKELQEKYKKLVEKYRNIREEEMK